MAASSKKVFVLDTNVLLHDPKAIYNFQEHDVVIPIVVIEEIDHFKKDQTEIGRNARSVSRFMDRLRAQGSLSKGVKLDGGGILKVDVTQHPFDIQFFSLDKHKVDNHILGCAQELLKVRKEKVVLVTKDTNLRIKADAMGLQAEDYTTDKVELEELYTGFDTWEVSPEKVDLLFDGGLALEEGKELYPNQFVTLVDQHNPSHTALSRYHPGDKLLKPMKRLEMPPWGVKPRNREQQFALDLLLDDSVQVVTLVGKAGTGKTLLAIAAGL